jgi:hypothetical protein
LSLGVPVEVSSLHGVKRWVLTALWMLI